MCSIADTLIKYKSVTDFGSVIDCWLVLQNRKTPLISRNSGG